MKRLACGFRNTGRFGRALGTTAKFWLNLQAFYDLETDAIAELEDLTSPIGAFVRECCIVQPGATVAVASAYEEYKRWCGER